MADPELRSDEQVLVRTPGIQVKAIPFEGILTSRRVILVDRAKNILPPKEIPLVTIQDAGAGVNANNEPSLTLSVLARTGDVRQMILVFPGKGGAATRDEWARIIREGTSGSFEQVIRKVIPGADQAPKGGAAKSAAQAAPSARRIIASSPAPVEMQAAPAPEPAGDPGSGNFCSRCGNRVVADSAFCDRCGAPLTAAPATVPRAPAAPAYEPPAPPAPEYEEPQEEIPRVVPPPAAPAPRAPAPKKEKKGFGSGLFGGKKPPAAKPPAASSSAGGSRKSGKILGIIAAIVVVVIVIAAGALFVLPMLTSGTPAGSSSGTPGVSPAPTSTGSSGSVQTSGTFVVPRETTKPAVPATGVYVMVSYLGSWKGTYGMPSEIQTAIDSGTHYYEIVNATGPVSATFQKQDGSKKQTLTLQIFKNGAAIATGSTTDAYGKVTVSADATTGAAASGGAATNVTAAATATTRPATTATIAANTTTKKP